MADDSRLFEARRAVGETVRPGEWPGDHESHADLPRAEILAATAEYREDGNDQYVAPCFECEDGTLVTVGMFFGTKKYDPYVIRACSLCGAYEEHPFDPPPGKRHSGPDRSKREPGEDEPGKQRDGPVGRLRKWLLG